MKVIHKILSSKKLLSYLIVLITTLACLFSVYPIALSLEKLPDENFVNVLMTRSIVSDCDTGDVGCILSPDLLVLSKSSASGLAIKTIDDKTYILTAYHFCEVDSGEYPHYEVEDNDIVSEVNILDTFGNFWPAYIESLDPARDLCLLSSGIPAVRSIKFSEKLPEMGERVFSLSAPLGVSDTNVVLHFEGIFSGCSDSFNCYFTIPATYGSSGSIIFDKKKRAIGILLRSILGFESVALGVSGKEIIHFLNESGMNITPH